MPFPTKIPKHLLAIVLLILMSSNSQAQDICEGSLGDNIFTEGDFGEGTTNIIYTNPNIAPGYNYTTNPPPNDGEYTITSNIASWNYAFDWITPQDNSSDPNGYMMVVNASFQPGLFYEQNINGLCENTTYEFSADIINLLWTGSNSIKPNVSFLIDGTTVFQTGDIPEDEQWNNYGFIFDTGPGQTSLTLALQNNAPGGQGNDLALDNITFRACGPEVSIIPEDIATICEDGNPITINATVIGNQYSNPVFQWQQSFDEGLTWQDITGETGVDFTHNNLSSGLYYYRVILAGNLNNLLNSQCHVFSNVKIVQVIPKFYNAIDTLCEGTFYEQGNNSYSLSGMYTDSLISSYGCDSIVSLQLTVLDNNLEVAYTPFLESCPGANDASITIDNISNGNEPISFVANDTIGAPFNFLSSGNYNITATDRYGCRYNELVVIDASSEYNLDIGDDLAIVLGETVQLEVLSNFTPTDIQWEPAELFDCLDIMDCLSASITPLQNTSISLTAMTESGCTLTDKIDITVEDVRLVYIPTAFSPNGDGINDLLTITADLSSIERIKHFSVINRWGELVFDQQNFLPNDATYGWDGSKNGTKQNVGVYVYLAEVEFIDGASVVYKGNITLIR